MGDEQGDDLLTTGEAAATLGVFPTTIIRYADRGELPVRRLPSGHRRFRRRDVEALLKVEERR